MTNPTTNFGWQMPTSTDLVTDLPADFEVFGQAVDTDFVDLLGGTTGQILSKTSATDLDFTWINNDQGDITAITVTAPITGGGTSGSVGIAISAASTAASGAVQLSDSTSTTSSVLAATPTAVKSAFDLATAAIPKSLVTTAGDIIYRNATVPARLGIGTAGQVLQVNSGATAPEWATATSGGMTLLSTTTLTGADVRIQSINQSYVNLFIIVKDATLSTNGIPRLYTQNDVTNYYTEQAGLVNATAYNEQTAAGINLPNNVATVTHDYAIQIFNYTSTTSKTFSVAGIAFDSGGPKKAINTQGGYHNGVAITEVDFGIDGATTYSSGTVYIYGVK